MNRSGKSERGQTLVLGIMLITVVLALTSIAVDVGLAFSEKAKLQSGVDASALAGAQLLPDDPTAATAAAQQMAIDNGIDPATLQIEITTTDYANDTIRVRATDESPAFFSRVLNFTGFAMAAQAASKNGSPAGMTNFIPLAVEQSVFANLETGQPATLKYDSQNQMNGNSLALGLTGESANCQGAGSTGACRFRNNVATGTTGDYCIFGQDYGCTSIVSTQTGQMIGPMEQGINSRLDATSESCDTFAEVITTDASNPGEMVLNQSCHPFQPYNVTSSQRVVIVPVIDHLCNGNCDVKIVQFAVFFVNEISCTQGGNGICSVTGVYAERVSNVRNYTKLGAFNPDAGFTFGALIE